MNDLNIVIELLPPARKYLKSIKKDKTLANKYKEMIQEIRNNPFIGAENKGDLKDIYTVDFRHHKTTYELAYAVTYKEAMIILIITAGTRENFYKELKRYLKHSNF